MRNQFKDNTDIEMQLIKDNDRDIYWKLNQKDINNVDNCKYMI